jgi:hypothetical protein
MLTVLLNNNDTTSSLELVEKITQTITSDEFMLDRQSSDTYNTLKFHFLSYYKTLIEYTVTNLKFIEKYEYSGLTEEQKNEIVLKIHRISQIHSQLVTLKKHLSFKDINVLTVLKNSKMFLNNFLKYEMPWLDKAFEDYREQGNLKLNLNLFLIHCPSFIKIPVVIILELVQKSVFFLQEYCLTNTSNAAVVKQTPQYMRCAEAFSFRIKRNYKLIC